MESGMRAHALPEGEGWHDFSGGFAHERGDGNEGVAASAQSVDQRAESGDRRGAVAAAVMHEDDGAAKLRLGLHGVKLGEDRLDDFVRGFEWVLIPVVGIDFAADDGVAHLLDAPGGRGLVVGVGLFVDVVGRAEVERLHAKLALKQALSEGDLEFNLARRDDADVGMRPGMIADLVAFADDALHEADVLGSLRADGHECAFDVLGLENIENLGRPCGIGTVVEG